MKKVLLLIGGVAIVVILTVVVTMEIVSRSDYSGLNSGSSVSDSAAPMADLGITSAPSMSVSKKSVGTYNESASSDSASTNGDKTIIKGGDISILVNDIDKTGEDVKTVAKNNGGEVTSSSKSEQDVTEMDITFRVPADKFEQTMSELRKTGVKVTSEYVNMDDVTDQYQDLNADLKNLQKTEEQFQEIMKKATTVDEILRVENELSTVRGKIERLQAQIQGIDRQADKSTITVYLSTDADTLPILSPESKWKPIVVLKAALRSLVGFIKYLSYALIWIVVFAIIWVPAAYLVRYIVKRRKAKNL